MRVYGGLRIDIIKVLLIAIDGSSVRIGIGMAFLAGTG